MTSDSRNAQKNYVREANNPPMVSYIVNNHNGIENILPITFTQEDTICLHYSQCNTLLVRIVIARDRQKCMLVTIRVQSTSDLVHPMIRCSWIINGFIDHGIIPSGNITMAVEMGTYPLIFCHFIEFFKVNNKPVQLKILGRLAFKKTWAITSIHYLCMKFSTKHGITNVRGDHIGP